jgi:hypothetical protein
VLRNIERLHYAFEQKLRLVGQGKSAEKSEAYFPHLLISGHSAALSLPLRAWNEAYCTFAMGCQTASKPSLIYLLILADCPYKISL